jgi:hypothetical protein
MLELSSADNRRSLASRCTSISVQFDGVGEDPKRHEGKYEPARNVHPDVAGNSYPINVDCRDHEDETNDQLDQHSEPQKSPTVHRSMFSAHKASRK